MSKSKENLIIKMIERLHRKGNYTISKIQRMFNISFAEAKECEKKWCDMNSDDEKVYVFCDQSVFEYNTRSQAEKSLLSTVIDCKGLEQARYANAYMDILYGKKICMDN